MPSLVTGMGSHVPNCTFVAEEIIVEKNVLFFARMMDLVNKVKKCSKSLKSKKLTELLFQIKDEIEDFTGQGINLENSYNQVVNDLKKNGVKLTKSDIGTIWNKLSKKHKKHLEISQYISDCFENGLEIDDYILKGHKHDDNDKEKQEVPIKVEIGVSIALCGFFLYCLPHPACKAAGQTLMSLGGMLAGEGVVSRMEDDQKERNNRKNIQV